MLAHRARGEETHATSLEGSTEQKGERSEPRYDNERSLRLVRSVLMLIALVSVIILWSEIHSAFGFLENISLWDFSTVQAWRALNRFTLGAVLIAVDYHQLVHTPRAAGTGDSAAPVADTGHRLCHTITKYLLLLIGGLVGIIDDWH